MAVKKAVKNMKFEEALSELEFSVQALENGDLPLEEALTIFKRGVELSQNCLDKLNIAQQEVQKIVEINDQKYKLELFTEEDE